MEIEVITTKTLFEDSKFIIEDKVKSEAFEIIRRAEPNSLAIIQDRLSSAVSEILETPVGTILVNGWQTCRDVQKGIKRSIRSPKEQILIPLIKHRVTSIQNPVIEIHVGPKKVKQLKVSVSLTLTVTGAELMLLAGRLVAVQTGSFQAQGDLSLEGVKLAKASSREFPLPGRIQTSSDPRFATRLRS